MSKCIICKKELPDDIKIPVCEYHRAQAKEKGIAVGSILGTAALTAKKFAPKVIPAVKKKAPIIIETVGKVTKNVIRK